MLIGETHRRSHHHHILPWPPEPATPTPTTNYTHIISSLRRHLLSSTPTPDQFSGDHDHFPAKDSDEEFFMYEFKVRMCTRPAGHDWTECPFAHSGEKARRRDPRKFIYSGESCPEFRKGVCKKGDSCELAHGVFESWLHPSKFRTQVCKDGSGCSRRVCFFAHSPDQLRSGSGLGPNPGFSDGISDGVEVVEDLVSGLGSLQLIHKVKSLPGSLGFRVGSPVFGSPPTNFGNSGRAGLFSLPVTPTRTAGGGWLELSGKKEEEVVMERVESGRVVRARMFEKLSKENS